MKQTRLIDANGLMNLLERELDMNGITDWAKDIWMQFMMLWNMLNLCLQLRQMQLSMVVGFY